MNETLKQRLLDKSEPVKFERAMGLLGSTTLGVGALMGAGLYVLVGIAADAAGPGIWISYGICGVLTFFSVLMFADFSRRLPISGGGYAYAYSQLGSFWGFMVGWHLAVGSIFACALYAYGFAQYAVSFLPSSFSAEWVYKLIACVLVAGLTGLALRGGGSERVQRILTWGNLFVLVVLAAVSIPMISGANFTPVLPKGMGGVGAAISLIYISFFGYQLIANSAEEIRAPERTVPKAMKLSIGIALFFYLVVAVIAVGAVPWEELAKSDAPLVLVAERGLGPFGAWLIGAGGILASGAALNSTLVSQGRQIFAMGRDRMLPKRVGTVRESTGVPMIAVLSGAAVTMAVIVLADLEFIAKSANFALLFSMLPISIALHRLYAQAKVTGEKVSLFKRVVPFAALAANAGLLLTLDWQSLMFGGVVVGVGCVVFMTYSYASEKRAKAGLSIDLAEGDKSFTLLDKGERILVPVANPDTLESLFSVSRALLPAEEGEIVALRVFRVDQGSNLRDALRSTAGSADAVEAAELANQIAKTKGVTVRPVVRAARDLAEGIVHGVTEERCKMVVMGWTGGEGSGSPALLEEIASRVRQDIVFLNLSKDVSPKRIGVALGGWGNLPLMVKVSTTLAEDFGGDVTYLNVMPEQFERRHLKHAREVQMAALERHDSLVPFKTELLRCDNPLAALVERSEDLDLLVVGTALGDSFEGEEIGSFATMLAHQAKCSVVVVRRAGGFSSKRFRT